MMNQTKPEPNASTIASLIVYTQQSLQLARDANSRITASCKPSLFLYSLYHEVSGRAIKQKQKQFQYHKTMNTSSQNASDLTMFLIHFEPQTATIQIFQIYRKLTLKGDDFGHAKHNGMLATHVTNIQRKSYK